MEFRIAREEYDALGFDLAGLVVEFQAALRGHAETEGVAAPIAHPLVERLAKSGEVIVIVEPPDVGEPPIPNINARQLRLWLVRQGVALASVDAAIDLMPEPASTEARIEWEYGTSYQRINPLIDAIGSALGLTPKLMDQGFRDAALI